MLLPSFVGVSLTEFYALGWEGAEGGLEHYGYLNRPSGITPC